MDCFSYIFLLTCTKLLGSSYIDSTTHANKKACK